MNPMWKLDCSKLFRSFHYACAGIRQLVIQEQNARVHLLCAVAVILLAALFRVTLVEWCILLLAVFSVWSAEAFNTAIEELSDVVEPNQNPQVRVVKDLAAGGVLLSALGACLVGLVIFGVRLIYIFV